MDSVVAVEAQCIEPQLTGLTINCLSPSCDKTSGFRLNDVKYNSIAMLYRSRTDPTAVKNLTCGKGERNGVGSLGFQLSVTTCTCVVELKITNLESNRR